MSRAQFESIKASVAALEEEAQGLISDLERLVPRSSLLTHPKIADSITDLIGRTPLLRLGKTNPAGNAEILLKLESMEPCSSVKVNNDFSFRVQKKLSVCLNLWLGAS